MKLIGTLLIAGSLTLTAGIVMAADGESIYNSGCAVCHALGVAGSPKMGDKAAWASRVTQDKATLYGHAINGFQGDAGVMPPKGGFMNLSDDDIKAAVDFMVESNK